MFEKDGRPIIFGEVLFGVFEDGTAVLGGAPFNIAWHLHGFGLRPLLISRIGQDEPGELVLLRMRQWGMDAQAVQIDPVYPTGRVDISIQDGEPHYDFQDEQAYDKISSGLVIELISDLPCSLLYCGSLAQRDAVSRKTLQRLMLEQALPLFVDINRRPPWVDEATISKTLYAAAYVKMNEAELAIQTDLTISDEESLQQAVSILRNQYDIEQVYITRGAKGASHVSDAGMQTAPVRQVGDFIDSVGAGDAFAAICLLAQIRQWPVTATLARANEFAAMICEQRGALIEDKSVYARLLEEWS